MSNNYSEQIFQSIDTIVSQRLNEVSFDKTEICEIISIDEKIINKYLVSNGSLKYEAYSDDENRKYLVGSKVYVRINNGDYGLKKIITGSYTADEIPKNLYTNPFNHLVVSSKYNWITEANKLSAIAYKDKTTDQDVYLSNDLTFYYSGLGQFNYIGLEFAATTGFGGTTGEFQIIINLLDSDGKSLLSDAQLGLLTLSSKQLYGNPYYLNGNLKFQHLFNFPVGNFSDLTKVKKVKITLATKGNFNYIEENDLAVIINDLTIFFGFDSSENEMSENKAALVLDNTRSLEYTTANDKKEMSIDWRDLNSGAIYNETPNMQYPEAGKYNIYWLQYSDSIGYAKKLEVDGGIDIEESGTYWKTVKRTDAATTEAYTYMLSPSADWKKEQIKVIIKKVGTNDYIESNGLTFTNTEFRTETGSNKGKADTLRLTLAEGDDGVYNSYGIDNKLLTSYNLTHSLTVDYVDNNKWDWNPSIQKVIWKIPAKATMIKHPGDNWRLENNFYIYDSDPNLKTINFNLSEQFSYNKTNNTIYCEIIRYKHPNSTEIENDEYQGSITLQFGLQGTAGTGWAFNITSSQRALTTPGGKANKMTLTVSLEDAYGEAITDSSWESKVKWSWYQTQYKENESNKRYTLSATTGKSIIVTRNNYLDHYAIIEAELKDWQDSNGRKVNLKAYYPIAAGNNTYYLTGASRVVYNSAGSMPIYDEEPYALYNSSHNLVSSKYTYSIISPETNKNKIFTLNAKEGSLKPLTLLPSQIPKMALQVWDPDNQWASYIQPILVLRNGYQSKTLNEWDGNLKIGIEDNSIFSALMGAGVKNADNTFTGVLLGAIGKEITSAKTGIYGIASGERRYSLDELGNFYVGTGSDNRIDFSGTGKDKTLTIEAKNFKLKVGDDLYFSNTAEASNQPYWLRFKDKVYFETDGTTIIGGWTIENNRIENIKAEDKRFYINVNPTSGTYDSWIAAGKYNTTSKVWEWPFYVNKNGILYASGAEIDGKFTINANSTLNGTSVSKINSTTITSTPDSIALRAFSQSTTINGKTQTLQAFLQTNADDISAKVSKNIDGSDANESMSWNLKSNSFIVKANGTEVMKVTSDGLTIKGNATFTGTVYASKGKIANWDIESDYLGSYGNVASTVFMSKGKSAYINQTGTSPSCVFYAKGDFAVTTSGKLYAASGRIAGWDISSNSISNGNTTLTADGTGKIECSSGVIGGWTLSSSGLTGSSGTYLYKNGRMSLQYYGWFNAGSSGYWLLGNGASYRCLIGDDFSMASPDAKNQYGQGASTTSAEAISNFLGKAYVPGSTNYKIPTVGMVARNGPIIIRNTYSNADGTIRLATMSNSCISINVGTTDNGSAGSIYISGTNNITLKAGSSGGVYAGNASLSSNSLVKTKAGDYSSKILKTNIVPFNTNDYVSALNLLKKIKLYNYDYKYNIIKNPINQYGFLIDELENFSESNKFFKFTHEKASIDVNNQLHLNPDEFKCNDKYIDIASFDDIILSKYLLTVCKALQQEVEGLKQEIKEIKQYEI